MTALVEEIARRVGFEGELRVLPWARALNLSTKPDCLIYPLARLPYREEKYRWIGPVLQDEYVFVVRRQGGLDVDSIDGFRDLRIGVNNGAPTHSRLTELGFTRIEPIVREEMNAMKLIAGRIDAWYTTKLMAIYFQRMLGYGAENLVFAFVDSKIDMYLGASLNLETVVPTWQQSLEAIKADSTYQEILKDHGFSE